MLDEKAGCKDECTCQNDKKHEEVTLFGVLGLMGEVIFLSIFSSFFRCAFYNGE